MREVIFKSNEELKKCCDFWKKILRLDDWDINCKLVKQSELSVYDRQGECSYILERKEALIMVLCHEDYPDDAIVPQDMEDCLIHELIHLHFALYMYDEHSDYGKYIAQEQTIVALTKALISLYSFVEKKGVG